MLTRLKNLFKRTDTTIMLGRWGNKGSNIKNIYANHDNCGDIICKNPKKITEFIKKEK
tara:strand:- start:4475 stop:4648 length:174 start_codon:yes stop_codon:yes gene_type:complete